MKLKIKISTFLFILLLSVSAYAQEDTYIVRFNDSVQLFSAKEKQGINYTVATEEELREYIDAGIVEDYEPNYEVVAIEPVTVETEQSVSDDIVDNWNFNMVNAAFAYKTGAMGNEVKVAVIDSGLYSDYMIRSQILNGYDYIDNKGTDAFVENDGSYHGTVVSSIIARQNNGYGTGIAPRVSIVPLRVLDDNGAGNVADVISAIIDATDTYKCDVINLSLVLSNSEATESNLTTLQKAINNAVDEGIIVIAAAGNGYSDSYAYPASLDGVISVASVESGGTHSSFSQHNNKVDIAAPGGTMRIDIMYRFDENGEEIFSLCKTNGTSLAAPHVSALAAIVKCIKPEIDANQFETLLQNTSGRTTRDDYLGYGVINCEAAIKKMIEGRRIYVSPVTFLDVQEEGYTGKVSEAIIYNNTENEITFAMVYGLYNDDKTLGKVQKGQGTLPAEKSGRWRVEYSGGNVKYMVWDSLENMVPLAPSSFK